MAGNSESRFVVCEDAEQVAKIVAVRDQLPELEAIIVDRAGRRRALARRAARARPRRVTPARSPRASPRSSPRTRTRSSTRRARPARPRAACSPRQLPPGHPHVRGDRRHRGGRARLPLPPARALLRAADPAAVRRPRRAADLLERRPAADRAGPDGDQAGLPAVGPAHLREDLHAGHLQQRPGEDRRGDPARPEGPRACRRPARRCPESLQAAFDKADAELYVNVRNIFGGNLKQATSGAAPIAQEILEFFYACGAPVLEGYGMTETSTVTTTSTVADHKLGTVGRPLPGAEVKIADDGEILDPRPAHLPRLLRHRRHDRVRRRRPTAGCTPATSARSTTTATSRSPAARRTS